jgi:hypothetical protein
MSVAPILKSSVKIKTMRLLGRYHMKEFSIGNSLHIVCIRGLNSTISKNFIINDKLKGKAEYNNQLYTYKVTCNKAIT